MGYATGIADTNSSMGHMKQLIEQKLTGVYVRALEITTYYGSIFTGIDTQVNLLCPTTQGCSSWLSAQHAQVEMACQALAADPNLVGGINVIGVSQVCGASYLLYLLSWSQSCVIQGAILMRGYLERCNNPPVKNFIAWVSPQMGVYGVPNVQAGQHHHHPSFRSHHHCRSEIMSILTLPWMTSLIVVFTTIGHSTSLPLQVTGEVKWPSRI